MDEQEQLDEIFRKRGLQAARDRRFGADLPTVPAPGIFQPDPVVVGDPLFSRMVANFMNRYPLLKQELKSVSNAPTAGSMRQMTSDRESGMLPYEHARTADGWSGTSLLGITSLLDPRKPGNAVIGVQPDMDPRLTGTTLTHEFNHAMGGSEPYTREQVDTLTERMALADLFRGMVRP